MKRLAFLLCLAAPASGAETAAFLKIDAGARAAALGSAYTAVADDVYAAAWNPAGLAGLPGPEVGVTHAAMFAGQRFDFAGAAVPTRAGTFAGSAALLAHQPLQGRDEQGRPTGSFEAGDQAFALSYGRPWSSRASAGASVKFIRSRLGDAAAQTAAGDFGLMWKAAPQLSLAFAARNVGPGLRFLQRTDALPLSLAGGAAWRLPVGLTAAAEYRFRPNSRTSEFAVGTEYHVIPGAALRAGYAVESVSGRAKGPAGLGGYAAGLGLRWGRYGVDYAFTPLGELGDVQRVALGARW